MKKNYTFSTCFYFYFMVIITETKNNHLHNTIELFLNPFGLLAHHWKTEDVRVNLQKEHLRRANYCFQVQSLQIKSLSKYKHFD